MKKQEFIERLRWFAVNEGHGLPDEYCHPNYEPAECVSMIEDVIAHWDADKLVRSDTIGMG